MRVGLSDFGIIAAVSAVGIVAFAARSPVNFSFSLSCSVVAGSSITAGVLIVCR